MFYNIIYKCCLLPCPRLPCRLMWHGHARRLVCYQWSRLDWLLETMAFVSWEDVLVLCPPRLIWNCQRPLNRLRHRGHHTSKLSRMFLLHFSTFEDNFKISHTCAASHLINQRYPLATCVYCEGWWLRREGDQTHFPKPFQHSALNCWHYNWCFERWTAWLLSVSGI